MADATSNRGATKALMYVLFILSAGAIGGALYLNEELTMLQQNRYNDLKTVVDINSVYVKQLDEYHEQLSAGTIKTATPEQMANVKTEVLNLLKNPDLAGLKFDQYDDPNEETDTNNATYNEHTLEIALSKVSRSRYEYIMESLVRKFGTFATINSFDVSREGRMRGEDINKAYGPNDFMYDVDIELLWHTQKANAGGSERPSRGARSARP